MAALETTEVKLKGEVAAYAESFDDVQGLLDQSCEDFGTFKTDLARVNGGC